MRFVKTGIAWMERLGVASLPEHCEQRYGYSFITNQKAHHFRMCTPPGGSGSGAKVEVGGKGAGGTGGGGRAAMQGSTKTAPATNGTAAVRKRSLLSAAAAPLGRHHSGGWVAAGRWRRRRRSLLQDADGAASKPAGAAAATPADAAADDGGGGGAIRQHPGLKDHPSLEPDNVTVAPPDPTSLASSVGCYLNPRMPRSFGQAFCVGRNVLLDTCALYDGQNEGFNVRFPSPKSGAFKVACSKQQRPYDELLWGAKNKIWWRNATFDAYAAVRDACDPAGDRPVVEHPVVFVMRDRFTHTLHELDVLSTIFTSLAVADLPEVRRLGVQVVLADSMPHASYRATYAAISRPYRLRHLALDPFPPDTCFRTALFVTAFFNSVVTNSNPAQADCFSPVMIGFHRWLRTLHKELDPEHLARTHPGGPDTSGGVARRAVVWASRRNLEAMRTESGASMSPWKRARRITNENQLVTALQLSVLEWNSRSCLLARYYRGEEGLAGCRNASVQFDLVFGEFGDLPYYPDQLSTAFRAGILVGVHGAALTFVAATTPGESAVVELVGEGLRSMNFKKLLNLFPSLTANLGSYYQAVNYTDREVNITATTDALVRAMDEVAQRVAAGRARAAPARPDAPVFNDQYNFDVMFPQSCPTSVANKLRRFDSKQPAQPELGTAKQARGAGGSSNGSSNSDGAGAGGAR